MRKDVFDDMKAGDALKKIPESEIAEYKEMQQLAREQGVELYFNDENGEWVWAVSLPDGYWLDAFGTKERAVSYCEKEGYKINRSIVMREGWDVLEEREGIKRPDACRPLPPPPVSREDRLQKAAAELYSLLLRSRRFVHGTSSTLTSRIDNALDEYRELVG